MSRTVGLNLNTDFANDAILFHPPSREQAVKWLYGHAEMDGQCAVNIDLLSKKNARSRRKLRSRHLRSVTTGNRLPAASDTRQRSAGWT